MNDDAHLVARLTSRIRDERGATAAEYALMASLIAVVIITAVTAVGVSVTALFQRAVDAWPA